MVRVPTETRYEEIIERDLKNLLDDGLQFDSKIHKVNDEWYNKDLCIIEEDFISFLKESQEETYNTLLKKYGSNTDKNILKRLNKEIESN